MGVGVAVFFGFVVTVDYYRVLLEVGGYYVVDLIGVWILVVWLMLLWFD